MLIIPTSVVLLNVFSKCTSLPMPKVVLLLLSLLLPSKEQSRYSRQLYAPLMLSKLLRKRRPGDRDLDSNALGMS